MGVKVLHFNKLLFISLLLFFFNSSTGFAVEKEIEGVINKYASVTSISGVDKVIVNNASEFSVGDTVLIIQMQGVEILTDDASYGTIQDKFGTPGGYEFLIIESININEVTFRNDLIGSYDVAGKVQLVRVPYYNNATVKNTLSSDTWDSDPTNPKTGGVLVFIVGRSLTLNADIDVTGKGFKGGSTIEGNGNCASVPGNDLSSYDLSSPNSGYKGEGVAIHRYIDGIVQTLLDPEHLLGKSPNYSGGGGGNGRFSGGGGGSNRGLGGIGGFEQSPACSHPLPGGLGGKSLNASPELSGGIFLGGGGGSSTYMGVSNATPGGRGGGIIIIITDTIIGNGRTIKADGANANNASGDAGAGGGGGGGSVVLSLQSYSNKGLTISAKGGNGGSRSVLGGGSGGGGGGGFVWVSSTIPAIPVNVTITTVGGNAGTLASPGTVGETRPSFKALLNGFLFNSIRSSITGNLVDSICSDVVPKELTGTSPVGGKPPYSYQWEKSLNNIAWISILGATSQNYTPTVTEPLTLYFRRIVTDDSIPANVDISKSVKIIVQPKITGNEIGKDTIICYNQNPVSIGQLAPITLGAGNGRYSFLWRDSVGNSNAVGINNLISYDPPALTQTKYFERIVTSGRCIDKSVAVKIMVLDTIKNNLILNTPEDICYGMVFTDLSATTSPTLGGGDNTYRFKWESNINNSGWGIAPGVSNGVNYNPGELSQAFPKNEYFFRRVVYSGLHDVCANTSKSILLNDFPVITNNAITSIQTICSGSVPAKLTGSNPFNGNGIYTYLWQDSTKTHTWTDISGSTSIDYQPLGLTDTTAYRRIVYSSACSNISKSIIVNVHKPLLNNRIHLISSGNDTTLCNGATPKKFQGEIASGGTNVLGDYAYEWYSSVDNLSFTLVTASGTNKDYQSGPLTITTYFKRKAISGQCSTYSPVITVTVLPLIANNSISASQQICINTAPARLTGSTPTGGAGAGSYTYLWEQSTDGTTWSSAAGANTNIDYQPPAVSIPMKYRRKVISGANNCCTNIITNATDWVSVTLWQDIDTIDAGPDKLFYSFENIDTLNALVPVLGSGLWTTISSDGSPSFVDETLYNTVVSDLGTGQNILEWTVSNGTCVKKDRVTIEVLELFVPEGFSPNGDAINDEFEILGLDIGHNTASLIILNSYGSQVFKDDNYEGRWDGFDTNRNELPEGTYYYLLIIQSDRIDRVTKKSGFIILKR